jgi:glutathione synthase/RimK-type ligase-like ATP-grasp enzyme
MVDEVQLSEDYDADVYLSMARLPETVRLLKSFEEQGATVINSAYGVAASVRCKLHETMRANHIPMPPSHGEHGYWLKRGDEAAQEEGDVVYCPDNESLAKAEGKFAARGIDNYVVTAHVPGDVVKFYGVGDRFFRYYYPSDDRRMKFSHELVNGEAHHYPFDERLMRHEVERLAEIISLDVYGGDAIVDEAGRFYIIDFNDWPSFSRCREEAANAIASLVKDRMK